VTVFGTRLDGINSRAGYMFQSEALMPWRNAIENVMAGLEFRGMARAQALPRARSGSRAWSFRIRKTLPPSALRRNAQTRGARADVHPQSADPAHGRAFFGARHPDPPADGNELLELWSVDRKSVVFITHDLEEAISLSDRVVVLSAGPASQPIGDYAIDLPRPATWRRFDLRRASSKFTRKSGTR